MKLFIYIFYCVFGFLISPLDTGEEVINALKQGKSAELVKFFDEKVSIKLINQEDVLSKAQAEANLKFFFEKHPVKTISSTHVSSINNNAQYITATLETTNGKFRISVLLKRNLISQFRIESDNE
jgi:hypothetical protein